MDASTRSEPGAAAPCEVGDPSGAREHESRRARLASLAIVVTFVAALAAMPRIVVTPTWKVDFLTRLLVNHSVPGVLGVGAIAIVLWRQPHGPLARHLRGNSWRRLSGIVVAALIASLALNALGLWPFLWRLDEGAGTYELMRQLVDGERWGLLVAFLTTTGLLLPLVEEVVFRHALLHELRRLLRRDDLAVVASSSLFVALHFLLSWRLTRGFFVMAVWAFLIAILLSVLALRRPQGGLAQAWVIHAARNSIEVAALLLVVAVPA